MAYVAGELMLDRLSGAPRRRVLFPPAPPRLRSILDLTFRYTKHRLTFGDLGPETVAEHDVCVPLTVPDALRLDALRPHMGHVVLPIPTAAAIALCDDKLAFVHALADAGFGACLPRPRGDSDLPYVLKRRVDAGGAHAHIVHDRTHEAALLQVLPPEAYCRQELIPGRFEYATHAVVVEGRIRCSLTMEYDMQASGRIKGPRRPGRARIVPTRHLGTFAAMLRAIGYQGLCCIDYKMRSRVPLILEVNPRIGGSLVPFFFSFLRQL